jgi:hypothetical protein
MYQSDYGVNEMPFNITPAPKFLSLSPTHQEALQHLDYGVQKRKGVIVLIGDRRSRGIPRITKNLCDKSGLAAFTRESDEVNGWDVRQARKDRCRLTD